jgi:hypothetical protein
MDLKFVRRGLALTLTLAATAVAFGVGTASASPTASTTTIAQSSPAGKPSLTLGLHTLVADTVPTVDFICSLDHAAYAPCSLSLFPTCVAASAGIKDCSQTKQFVGLSEGAHTFSAFSTQCDLSYDNCDDPDFVDGPVSTFNFSVDQTPPVISITAGPTAATPIYKNSAAFVFGANESASFQCSLDTEPFISCVSPLELTDLTNGSHTVSIKAADSYLNQSAPISQAFTVAAFVPKKCPKAGKSKRSKKRHASCVKSEKKRKANFRRQHHV